MYLLNNLIELLLIIRAKIVSSHVRTFHPEDVIFNKTFGQDFYELVHRGIPQIGNFLERYDCTHFHNIFFSNPPFDYPSCIAFGTQLILLVEIGFVKSFDDLHLLNTILDMVNNESSQTCCLN